MRGEVRVWERGRVHRRYVCVKVDVRGWGVRVVRTSGVGLDIIDDGPDPSK